MAYAPGVRVLHAINSIPGTAWLSQRSYLYSLGLNAGWNAGKRMLLDQALAALATEYAIGTQELNGPMKALEVALIRRLHQATKARGIPLIIADLPTRNDEGGFLPSIPADILESFRANSEALVLSENVLGPYRGLTEFHVPHGNWHTNEFTHLMLGRAVANEVAGLARSF